MRTHQRGFSLLEVLIYTAFIGTIMVSMTLVANAAFTMRSKLRAALILEQNLRFAVGRVTALVTEASGMTTPALGATSGTLVLVMTTTSTNPTTVTNIDGIVYVTQGATGTAQALTSNEVSMTTLSFTRVSSTSAVVRIVASGGPRNAASSYGTLTVTTTAAVRR